MTTLNDFDIRENESLAQYNTWRIGGWAERIFIPKSLDNLIAFLKNSTLEDNPLHWIGLGSNLLVKDEPYKGTVIITQKGLTNIYPLAAFKDTVRVEAGVACPVAARTASRMGLTGIEFLAGVPGTMGGALAMNAGAHGGETWQFVTHCEVVDSRGNFYLRPASDYKIGYREVQGLGPKKEWFVAAYLKLMPGDKTTSLCKIKELLAVRAATQPINLPNCGSVFRNPPGNYAAKLIENCNLKNYRIGGAYVSEKHANFIITDKTATAHDVQNLIQYIQIIVKNTHGIDLIREVRTLD